MDSFPVFSVPNLLQKTWAVLHQLWHPEHDPVEAQQRRGARLQRLRALLQAARGQQAPGDEEGGHPNPKEESQEWVGSEKTGYW